LCHLFIFTFDYFQVQVGFDRFTTVFGSVQVFLLNHFSVGKYVVRIIFCSFDENYLVLWLLLRTQISLNKTCLLCVCEFVNDHCFSIFFATPFTNTHFHTHTRTPSLSLCLSLPPFRFPSPSSLSLFSRCAWLTK